MQIYGYEKIAGISNSDIKTKSESFNKTPEINGNDAQLITPKRKAASKPRDKIYEYLLED